MPFHFESLKLKKDMLYYISKFLLFLAGWKVDENIPKESTYCVMIASPHTSNWDAYYLILAFQVLRIPMKFTIKKEWLGPPAGWILKPLGGLGIDRKKGPDGKKSSYVEQMAGLFKERERIAMVVAPEGTRSLRKRWKMGFYHTAVQADVPITFGYLDYKRKIAGVGGVVHPTGDVEKDMEVINAFYRTVAPKYDEKYSLDERYS